MRKQQIFNFFMPKEKMTPCLEDNDPCPVNGKYTGKKMTDVPASYLLWLYDQEWLPIKYPTVYAYITNTLEYLKDECPDYISKPKSK